MAIAVIGGLLTSTFLSLLVVPVVFTFVDALEQRFRRARRRPPGAPVHEVVTPASEASA